MKSLTLAGANSILLVFLSICSDCPAQFQASDSTGASTNAKDRSGTYMVSEKYRDVEKIGKNKYDCHLCAPVNPSKGPSEPYVYENSLGIFKLTDMTSDNSGSAKYTWIDGTKHNDTLTYLSYGNITETQGYLIPIGTKVSVWAYRAEDDKGNHFFLYFGTEPIINAPQGKRYPLYYGFSPPGDDPTWRIPTPNGTTRK